MSLVSLFCEDSWPTNADKSLSPSFKNLAGFLDEAFSDVTVTVSYDNAAINTYRLHRNVLAGTSSCLHEQMLCHQELNITYMSPAEFELLLVFMYSGDVRFQSIEELCLGIYVGSLLKIDSLRQRCMELLKQKLDDRHENALLVLRLDERFKIRTENVDLFDMVNGIIRSNYQKILCSEEIKDADENTIKHLLQMNNISEPGPEIEVFRALLKWSRNRCVKRDVEPTSQNLLEVVDGLDLTNLIHYDLIPKKIFATEVVPSGLLPTDLILSALRRSYEDDVDVPFCTGSRQKVDEYDKEEWDLKSTCTTVEHKIHEVFRYEKSTTLLYSRRRNEFEWLSLPEVANANTQWQVKFHRSSDDFGVVMRCRSLDEQFCAATARLFAVIENHPQVWLEGAAVFQLNEATWGCYFSKKMTEQQTTGLKVQVRVQWNELYKLSPTRNLWSDAAAFLRCRWQLQGWNAIVPTTDFWTLSSESFGRNGAIWRICLIYGCNSKGGKLKVRLQMQLIPTFLQSTSSYAVKSTLTFCEKQLDERWLENDEEKPWCEWKIINSTRLRSSDALDLNVIINIYPEIIYS